MLWQNLPMDICKFDTMHMSSILLSGLGHVHFIFKIGLQHSKIVWATRQSGPKFKWPGYGQPSLIISILHIFTKEQILSWHGSRLIQNNINHGNNNKITTKHWTCTVDSRYLEFQGTLWNASKNPYLDISELQNWGKNKLNNHIYQMYM